MKLIFLLLSCSLLLFGCKKIDSLTQFDMEYDVTLDIPSSTGVNLPFNIVSPDIESNSEATFEVNDTRKDLIERIYLEKLTLTVTSPPGEDFSFLKSISIYISADGLDEVVIAGKDIPDNAGSSIDLEVSAEDIKEYLKQDKFTLRVNTVTDEIITSDYTVNAHCVFFVDAKLLKM